MWLDERGSEVLELPECRRLLALGAKQHLHGHVGIGGRDAPTILPVDYAVNDSDILVLVGEGLFHRMEGKLVAFEVDGTVSNRGLGPPETRPWSILVTGLATEEVRPPSPDNTPFPTPAVANPGHRLVRIRTDAMSGRKLAPRPE